MKPEVVSEQSDQVEVALALYDRIRAYAESHPDTSPIHVARVVFPALSESEVLTAAFTWIADTAQRIQRDIVLKAERRAERFTFTPSVEKAAKIRSEQDAEAERQVSRILQFEWFKKDWGTPSNRKDRAEFREWMGEEAFREWYSDQRSKVVASSGIDSSEYHSFEAAWFPDGVTAYYDHVREQKVIALCEEMARITRLEVTRELLDSYFSIGDGETRVKWGEATIEQHQQRIDMLIGNASGNAETAARHMVAIRMIQQSGLVRLKDLDVEAR